MTEEDLEREFPEIRWREPVPIIVPTVGEGLGCRICIALYGFRAVHVLKLSQSAAEFADHMELMHPVPTIGGAG